MATELLPSNYESLVRKAIRHYWQTLSVQANRQKADSADRGRRAAVTGGKQMDGFCDLVQSIVAWNGMPEASVYVRRGLELPGYFRPTKRWDLIVVHAGHLVAAVEFKSQVGPSFGNNFNNRTEEALGSATDIWTAYREGAFGKDRIRPWVGWLLLLEDCEDATTPVKVDEPHFGVFPEFRGASYAGRYEILLRKLMSEKLYDGSALILARRAEAKSGRFREPAIDLSIKRFLAGLGGHVRTFQASL
ncbi:MAG: restriction endonuclease [Deltaproteobacteria bacterium]|nr:restriction endonuclease [Deltaproteobacteria bacterium]